MGVWEVQSPQYNNQCTFLTRRGVLGWALSSWYHPLNRFQALVVEAIGGEVTEESKVRNNCDNYDVSIIMNVKGAKIP